MEKCDSPRVTDSKIALYWEKGALYLITALVGICVWLFLKQETKVEQLEVKVHQLQVDKVSRQELKDLEDRLYKQMDRMEGAIIFHINALRENK